MAMAETAEIWTRIDLFCDGLGNDGICVGSRELDRISDVAPTAQGAQKAILNAVVKSRWTFDVELHRWLCPDCANARDSKNLAWASGAAQEADARPLVPLLA